ncbi:MAG: ABC transporter transmembrane domain-containing protein, partial [Bacilli bacterium]|nr:ABC transporter transmembrane domain-containing protein [Bacilli bacterium]
MFKFFVELKWFFKRNLIKYIIIGVVSIAYTYLVTIPPSIIGQFVDKITYQSLSKTFVYQIFFLMLGVTISIYTTSLLKKIMLGNLYHSLFYKLKNIYLESIFKQDGDFFEKYHSGDLISRAMGDNRMVANTSTHLVFSILDTITMLLVVSVQMIIINPRLTILSVIPLPLILVLILYLRPKISRNWRLVRNEHSHLNNLVMESVANVKMIRGFTNEIKDQQKLDDSANTVYKIERKSILMQSVISPSFQIITLISQGIALSFGAYFIMKQSLSPGQLITFYLYLGMFAGPLLSLGNQITALSQSSVSLDRFNEILNAVPAIDKPITPVKLNEIEVIKFDNVSFKYPKSSEYAIKNINLE